jgi:hypothetical protein
MEEDINEELSNFKKGYELLLKENWSLKISIEEMRDALNWVLDKIGPYASGSEQDKLDAIQNARKVIDRA